MSGAPFLAHAVNFSDSYTSPFDLGIEYGAEKDYLGGFSDGTYRPYDILNRAAFAKAVISAVSSEKDRSDCMKRLKAKTVFDDVPVNAWFAPYICVGKKRGFMKGYKDGSFHPDDSVNFAEASTIIARAFSLPLKKSDEKIKGNFVWYRSSSLALAREKAIPETIDTYSHLMNRGEMAEIIYRLQTKKTSLPSVTSFIAAKYKEEGFAFGYPADIFAKATTTASVPFGAFPPIAGRSLIHALQAEDCGISNDAAQCTPLTIDLSIGFYRIPAPFAALKSQAEDWMTETTHTEAGRTGFLFTLGAEGTSTDYVFLPLSDSSSLMITREYLDEDGMKSKAKIHGLLATKKQRALFEQVLSTIQFYQSLSPTVEKNSLTLSLFFYSQADLDRASFDYANVAIRTVTKGATAEDTALRELFKGPTSAEKENGAHAGSLRDIGVFYEGISVERGLATVRFSLGAEQFFASEKRRSFLLAPLRSTLLQFSSVDQVDFTVAGELVD